MGILIQERDAMNGPVVDSATTVDRITMIPIDDSHPRATRQGRKRRRTTAAPSKQCLLLMLCYVSFLLWSTPCFASSKKQESQWSYMTDSLGSIYISEDETEERILAALADMTVDDDNDSGEPPTDDSSSFDEPKYEESFQQRQRRSSPRISAPQKHKPKQICNKLSYVTLPETFRAKPASSIRPTTSVAATTPSTTVSKPVLTTTKMIMMNSPATATSMSPWIRRFLASCQDDALLPLPLDFLLDNFNLAQLAPVIERIALQGVSEKQRLQLLQGLDSSSSHQYPIYRRALELLVQQQQQHDSDDDDDDSTTIPAPVERATRALYVLLHQRFCLSPRGLDLVRRRFVAARDAALIQASGASSSSSSTTTTTRWIVFGECPTCRNVPLLPCGDSDNYQSLDGDNLAASNQHTCKRYCCNCRHVFLHRASIIDGCAWGPSFCHLFVMTFGKHVLMTEQPKRTLGKSDVNERDGRQGSMYGNCKSIAASVFGFRLHPSSGQ